MWGAPGTANHLRPHISHIPIGRVASMKKNGADSLDTKKGMKRIIVRAGVALLLGASLFAGMALAGASIPQPKTEAPAVSAVSPDMFKREGDTIGLGRIIRFRVIAASDSAFDQSVKLRVRDAVLAYLHPELQSTGSEPAAAAVISGRLPGIRQVARQTAQSAGSDKPVQVFYGVTAFPNKTYGSVVFPAGNYEALKIVIGAGQGHNWWCVLFPPLCYVDLTQAAQDLSGGQEIVPSAAGMGGRVSRYPRLTTKIGVWFTGVRSHSLAFLHIGG
jgi:stage II sporulation protein R